MFLDCSLPTTIKEELESNDNDAEEVAAAEEVVEAARRARRARRRGRSQGRRQRVDSRETQGGRSRGGYDERETNSKRLGGKTGDSRDKINST